MEQLKILNMINRWGYLDLFQIALLVDKNLKNVERQLSFLRNKKFILVNQQTRKNIYSLSTLGSRYIGKESKKGHINLNQLEHQDLMIKWLSNQENVSHYENELEIKRWNSKQDKYPDLMIEYENGTKAWVEIERTRKAKERIEKKIDNMRSHITDGHKIIWVVPDEKMRKFLQNQIDKYNWKKESHTIEIFN